MSRARRERIEAEAFGIARDREPRASARTAASRKLYLGASALSFSVAADSSMEHYRGGFYHRAMYIAPVVSALTLAASLPESARAQGGVAGRRPLARAGADADARG